MSQFTRFFSGKFQYFGNCAGVKHLTNMMSVVKSHLVNATNPKPPGNILK